MVNVGDQIGDWLVQRLLEDKSKVECVCFCGRVKNVRKDHLFAGLSLRCRHCAKIGIRHGNWKGHGEIGGQFWAGIKRGAKTRNISCEIEIDYCWELFLQQDRKCALTGLPLSFKRHYKDPNKTTASLDRVDSNIGYVKGNIQWLHKTINKMKNDIPQDQFVDMCNLVARKFS